MNTLRLRGDVIRQFSLDQPRRERSGRRRTVVSLAAIGVLVLVLVLSALSGLACTTAAQTAVSHNPVSTVAPGGTTTASSVVTSSTTSPASSTTSTIHSTSVIPSTTSAAPSTVPVVSTTEAVPKLPVSFDSARAMKHIKVLAAEIGIRPGGGKAEGKAVTYASEYLAELGYEPVTTEVLLPNGKTSHNVIAIKKGASPLTVLVGAHLDTKRSTPGGNDDASGSAVVLELARDFADADMTPTIVFVLFGQEEIIDDNKNHHHYGSRNYVANMTAREQKNLAAMISLDMVAYGDTFNARTMGKGPLALSDMLRGYARANEVKLVYLRDPGPSGWSDHEPFELAGYPAVWLQRLEDPEYHKAGDTYEHCKERLVRETGRLVHGFLTELSPKDLETLHAAVRRQ
jgi:aminopeptidase YwaD